jgi:hypothetical protein
MSSTNTHIFFCIDATCNKTVPRNGAPCCLEHNPLVEKLDDSVSYETSECPGCGNDIYCGADGYCANCWVERVGTDDEHVCSGEVDYETGRRVCDDDDCPYSSPRPNSIASPRMYRYICSSCDETFTTTKCKDEDDRVCGDCHLYAVDVIKTWWRGVRCGRKAIDPPADMATGWCPECDMYMVVLPNICERCQQKCRCDGGGQCDGCVRRLADEAEYDIWCGVDVPKCTCDESGRMCEFCAEEYAEPCRSCGVPSQLWTDEKHCRECFVKLHGCEFPKKAEAIYSHKEVCGECEKTFKSVNQDFRCRDCGGDSGSIYVCADCESTELAQGSNRCYTCIDGERSAAYAHAPRTTSVIQDEIDNITEKLEFTRMTPGQRADWQTLLDKRKAEIADMWEGYDQDDLNKMDLANRRGF